MTHLSATLRPARLRRSTAPLLSVLLVLAACSSGGEASRTPGATLTVENGRVELSADNLLFDASTIEAPAGAPFTVVFTNEEDQPHNFAAYLDEGGDKIVQGEIITGPDETVEVQVPALEAGTYYFQCDVHPQMKGSLVVKESGP